nr:hypothetical protein [Mucilaginibacter rubeus]
MKKKRSGKSQEVKIKEARKEGVGSYSKIKLSYDRAPEGMSARAKEKSYAPYISQQGV